MNSYVGNLLRDSQIRKVGTLASGILFGQLAVVLATPLLTRIYSVGNFGDLAMFTAAVGIFAPIAALRLELSIPIPQVRREAWHAFLMAVAAAVSMALLVSVVVWVNPTELAKLIGLSESASWAIWALPVALALAGFHQALMHWGMRENRVAAVSQSRGSQGFVSSGTQIAMGAGGLGALGLIAGDLFGRAVASAWLFRRAIGIASARPIVSRKLLLATGRKFIGFPLLSAPSALANSLSIYLPLIVVGHYFGLEAAGLFLLAQRIVGLPTTMLVSPISQVFIVQISNAQDASERSALYRATVRRFALMAGPLFGAIAIVSPFAFPWIFGDAWAESGMLALVLAPYYFVQLLSGGTVCALDVLQAHRVRLAREIIFLAGTIVVLVLAGSFDISLFGVVMALAAFGVAFYTYSLVWVHKVILKSTF